MTVIGNGGWFAKRVKRVKRGKLACGLGVCLGTVVAPNIQEEKQLVMQVFRFLQERLPYTATHL